MTKVDFTLTGCANGHPVRIAGTGPLHGQIEFAAIEEHLTFCPRLAQFAGLDAIVALAAELAVGHDDPVVARSRADFLTEGGVEVGTIVAHTTIHRRSDGYACLVQLAEARVAMEVDERITAIGERTVRATRQDAGVALFSTARVSTSRGHQWTALVTTLLVGCCVGGLDSLSLPATGG